MSSTNGFCRRCGDQIEGNTYGILEFKTVSGRITRRVVLCEECCEETIFQVEHASEFVSWHLLREQCPHAQREAYRLSPPEGQSNIPITAPQWGWRCVTCGFIGKEF